jgi:hypothetical protein
MTSDATRAKTARWLADRPTSSPPESARKMVGQSPFFELLRFEIPVMLSPAAGQRAYLLVRIGG